MRRAKARRLKGENGDDDPELDDDVVSSVDADEDEPGEAPEAVTEPEEPAKSGRIVPDFPVKH